MTTLFEAIFLFTLVAAFISALWLLDIEATAERKRLYKRAELIGRKRVENNP